MFNIKKQFNRGKQQAHNPKWFQPKKTLCYLAGKYFEIIKMNIKNLKTKRLK